MNSVVPIADPDEQAAEWCLRLSEGPLDETEQVAFDQWIDREGNDAAFQDQLRLWDLVELARHTPEMSCLRAQSVATHPAGARRAWFAQVRPYWRQVGALATAAMLAMAVWTGFRSYASDNYATAVGEHKVATLDDGSRLTLDARSSVTVRMADERRELSLERGRAKFDVAYDPLRPFVVTVGDRKVIATGTAFSVERIGVQVRVILYEGHVAIVAPGVEGVPSQLRTPGYALTLPPPGYASASKETVDIARSLNWEQGQLDFQGETLAAAAERINRYAKIPIEIAPDARDIQVTGVFSAGQTDAFVEGVSHVHGLHVRREAGQIVLARH